MDTTMRDFEESQHKQPTVAPISLHGLNAEVSRSEI